MVRSGALIEGAATCRHLLEASRKGLGNHPLLVSYVRKPMVAFEQFVEAVV